MIQLPAGATGFFEANAAREPISQKEFLQLAHRLARENRGILREADTDLCGKNFYAAYIVWAQGQETLLMTAYTGHLAYSGDRRIQPTSIIITSSSRKR